MVLTALFASVFSFGVSFGGLVPWIALVLEARGTDATLIGIVSAANPVGVLLAAPLVPLIVRRFGAVQAMLASGVVSLVSILLLPVFDSVAGWLVLRLISGFAGGVPWVITETWINVVAGDRTRGRVVALYGAIIAAGFASGPIVLTIVGIAGLRPVVCFAVLQAAALVPILLVRNIAPKLGLTGTTGLRGLVTAMPVLLAAAFLAGAVDTAFFSFLPIWGTRSGLEESFALTLLSIFIAGNILMQVPLGWLADMAGYRRVMTGCGCACILGPVLALQSIETPVVLGTVMFLWGGSAWGLYTIALTALGRRFEGGALTAANAAFVMTYTVANISGPLLAGTAMEIRNPDGLMMLMLGLGAAFTALVAGRSIIGRGS
ncbi:MAG: MFS transporter [Hyphomicrobiales bacterium]